MRETIFSNFLLRKRYILKIQLMFTLTNLWKKIKVIWYRNKNQSLILLLIILTFELLSLVTPIGGGYSTDLSGVRVICARRRDSLGGALEERSSQAEYGARQGVKEEVRSW